MANALQRAASADIAAYTFVVDAKDGQAARFYTHHGFTSLPDAALPLFLPLAGVAPFSWGGYWACARTCKLFDYEAGRWVGFARF